MITIVSGIPRSGTSMMMQMLAAGGMPVLTDHVRTSNPDTPRGYLEWEGAKRLPREPHLIAEAEGKCVKIVSQLLFALNTGHEYQVIFMNRDLGEVVSSQNAVTERLGTTLKGLSNEMLLRGLRSHLGQVKALLHGRAGLRLIDVHYQAVLATRTSPSTKFAIFSGRILNRRQCCEQSIRISTTIAPCRRARHANPIQVSGQPLEGRVPVFY
ncbi:MAG: sulfotransferase family protein [Acidobacteriales bacterium]|nr:sulfotransferase family protein [Terriglobales bacterium]